MNQIIDQACLVQINIAILYDFFEVLYADRIFHIAAILKSFGKVTKNNDTSKGIARKKNSETEKVQLRKNEKAAGGILPMPTTAFPLFIYATTV